MTLVDILLGVLLIAIIVAGYLQGVIRLMIALVMFYASIVLASLYFRFLAIFFTRRGIQVALADSISFIVILLVAFTLLFGAGVYTFRYIRVSHRLDILNKILGTLLGVALAGMVSVIVAMVLHYAYVRNNAGGGASFPATLFTAQNVGDSVVVQFLLDNVLPRLYSIVAPFVPEAAQPFFRPSP